jgi:arylsulfatase A-like enzyme
MDEHAMLAPAVEWAARGGPEPYLLTVLTVTPHHPYEVPGEPWQGDDHAQYLRALRHQDRFVGALLRELEAAGALADAVVVLVGDHGEAFGEHQGLQHDVVPYEEVARAPLLLLGPEARIGPPRRVGGLRHHFDLVPTLLELAGARWRGVLPGRSLLTTPGHERVATFCWYPSTCAALRQGDRKVVYHFGRRPTEVFDLAADPGETRDLAPALPAEEVAAAERALVGLKLSVDAFYARYPQSEGSALWWAEVTPDATAPSEAGR